MLVGPPESQMASNLCCNNVRRLARIKGRKVRMVHAKTCTASSLLLYIEGLEGHPEG
jgi:hypothetical protein